MTSPNKPLTPQDFVTLTETNKQLTQDLRKAQKALQRRDRKISEMKEWVKDRNQYNKWIEESDSYCKTLEGRISVREEALKQICEIGEDKFQIVFAENRLKELKSQLESVFSEIAERRLELTNLDSKVRYIRELESSIEMMSKDIAKRGATLHCALVNLTALYVNALTPQNAFTD